MIVRKSLMIFCAVSALSVFVSCGTFKKKQTQVIAPNAPILINEYLGDGEISVSVYDPTTHTMKFLGTIELGAWVEGKTLDTVNWGEFLNDTIESITNEPSVPDPTRDH